MQEASLDRHSYLTGLRWIGRSLMRPRVFGNLDDGIYWLKKDEEEENTIIGTHTRDAGGITVTTLENDQVLWSL